MAKPTPAAADPMTPVEPVVPLLRDETPPLRPGLLDFNPAKQRMENLDALRILAMLVIIVTHVTQPYVDHQSVDHQSGHRPYGALYNSVFSINVMLRFGVPCFMMISFFIYWHQLYDKGRSWGELLSRRFKRLIPAFIVWSLFYFALHKVLEKVHLNLDPGPMGDRLDWTKWDTWRNILLLGQAHEHLYYLPVVICSLLLIPLLRVLWKSPALAWTWIGTTLLAWTFVAYGCSFLSPDSRPGQLADRLMWVWRNFLALPLLVFPLLGMMCAGLRGWREFIAKTPTALWVGLLILGLALHITETLVMLNYGKTDQSWAQALAGLKVGRFLTAVPVFVLFLRHPLMKDPFPRVSHYAFGLHFMHPAVIIGLLIMEKKLFGDAVANWDVMVVPMLLVNFVLTFFITFALCLIVGRFKRLEFLVV